MRYISKKLVIFCLSINFIHYWAYAFIVYSEGEPIGEWLSWSLWSVPSIVAFDVLIVVVCCLIDPVKNIYRHLLDKVAYKKLIQIKELYDKGILDDEEYAQELSRVKRS